MACACSGPKTKTASAGAVGIFWMHFEKLDAVYFGHAHTYSHLSAVTNGSVKIIANGKTTVVKAGELMWIPRNVSHEIIPLEKDSKVMCIHAFHKLDDPGDIIDECVIPAGIPKELTVPLFASQARTKIEDFDRVMKAIAVKRGEIQ